MIRRHDFEQGGASPFKLEPGIGSAVAGVPVIGTPRPGLQLMYEAGLFRSSSMRLPCCESPAEQGGKPADEEERRDRA